MSIFGEDDKPDISVFPIVIGNIEIDHEFVLIKRRLLGDWRRPLSWFSYIYLIDNYSIGFIKPVYEIKLAGPDARDLPQSFGSFIVGSVYWTLLSNQLRGQFVDLYMFRNPSFDVDRFVEELSTSLRIPVRHRVVPDSG
jgi:hypothetical protein